MRLLIVCLLATLLPSFILAEEARGTHETSHSNSAPAIKESTNELSTNKTSAGEHAEGKKPLEKSQAHEEYLNEQIASRLAAIRAAKAARAAQGPRTIQFKKKSTIKPKYVSEKDSLIHDSQNYDHSKPIAHEKIFTKEIQWAYEGEHGPMNWGKINPAWSLCNSGQRQSPIDIRDGIKVDLEPIKINYKSSNFNVLDNGHTIQVNVSLGNEISVMGHIYELVEFHFHRPSEERINGRGYEMVVHLVHRDLDGRLAYIALLIERGIPNAAIQTVWNYLPLEQHQTNLHEAVIDLNKLLPEKREYYTYMGSITTPPCTEGILWMVFKQPIQLSPSQIAIFARLYPMNARSIQPMGKRLIKESQNQ